jgi:hypothetical protein
MTALPVIERPVLDIHLRYTDAAPSSAKMIQRSTDFMIVNCYLAELRFDNGSIVHLLSVSGNS